MLRFLRVSNLAVVRAVEIDLDEGLTVLTGETGAGKSILIDALTLLLGARASADLIRTGSPSAAVEGIFRVEANPGALALLGELGIEAEDGDLVLRRELTAAGKGRAYVNGALHPVSTLRRLGAALADVYGQLEHVRLLDPATHIDLLDHFAGLGAVRQDLAEAYRQLHALDQRLLAAAASDADRSRRADFLRFELGEIEEAKPESGEDHELERERRILANRARVLELSEGSFQRLYESDDALLARLAAVARDVAELAAVDAAVEPLGAAIETARAGLEDVALTLRDYARDVSHDPARLDQVERRLALLDRLKAKYGPSLADVARFAAEARDELRTLVVSDEERGRMTAEREVVRRRAEELAAAASRARKTHARRLEELVEQELGELAMEKTRFRVRIAIDEDERGAVTVGGRRARLGPNGVDQVEFHVSPNVGEDPKPLGRVASGGELSRLLLALRTVAADHEPARIAVFHGLEAGLGSKVAVFDEVDAGIGGRVAYVLARKLKRLARGRQVLCITHLAPVAAAADRHLRARKEERRGRTEVTVEALAPGDRIDELSRMIGGDSVTDAVRRHAEELLAARP
jgi:DNA repair protein RecN (Recombination protein N)